MNKIKIIRRRVTKACNGLKMEGLDMLRLTGVKRRHKFLRSYVKTGDPINVSNLKKKYKKPIILNHDTNIIPRLRCKLFL